MTVLALKRASHIFTEHICWHSPLFFAAAFGVVTFLLRCVRKFEHVTLPRRIVFRRLATNKGTVKLGKMFFRPGNSDDKRILESAGKVADESWCGTTDSNLPSHLTETPKTYKKKTPLACISFIVKKKEGAGETILLRK